jgi:hypothetical protein
MEKDHIEINNKLKLQQSIILKPLKLFTKKKNKTFKTFIIKVKYKIKD